MTENERFKTILQEQQQKKESPERAFIALVDGIGSMLKLKKDTRAEVAEIMSREEYAQDFRERRADQTKAVALDKLRYTGRDLLNRTEALKTLVEQRREPLNVTDPAFASVISFVTAAGDGMDPGTQSNLVAQFAGQAATLKALRPVFERAGLRVAVEDANTELKRLERAEHFPDAAAEFVSEFSHALESLAGVDQFYGDAAHFAKVHELPEVGIPEESLPFLMAAVAFGELDAI